MKGAIPVEVRFSLTPADPALAEELAAFYRRNRAFLQAFEPVREESFFTSGHQRGILEQEAADWQARRAYRFYLRPTEDPERIIGSIGLNHVVWGAFRSCFLGYKLEERYCGQGYMTQAVAEVTQYAFEELHLHRIEANVMPRNIASLRVLEKNGYTPEGLAKEYLYINGVWEDHIHMVKRNDALQMER